MGNSNTKQIDSQRNDSYNVRTAIEKVIQNMATTSDGTINMTDHSDVSSLDINSMKPYMAKFSGGNNYSVPNTLSVPENHPEHISGGCVCGDDVGYSATSLTSDGCGCGDTKLSITSSSGGCGCGDTKLSATSFTTDGCSCGDTKSTSKRQITGGVVYSQTSSLRSLKGGNNNDSSSFLALTSSFAENMKQSRAYIDGAKEPEIALSPEKKSPKSEEKKSPKSDEKKSPKSDEKKLLSEEKKSPKSSDAEETDEDEDDDDDEDEDDEDDEDDDEDDEDDKDDEDDEDVEEKEKKEGGTFENSSEVVINKKYLYSDNNIWYGTDSSAERYKQLRNMN